MRIAQIAPLIESVPPAFYGGTERIVSYLTEELVRQGHDVTLFASADSVTTAKLVPCCESALRLNPNSIEFLPHHLAMLEKVRQSIDLFEVLHFHTEYLHFPIFHSWAWKTLSTFHGRQDLWDIRPLYRDFCDMPVVSISDKQREPIPWMNWLGTVHHGLPHDLYSFVPQSHGYLAFLGRVSMEKRLDRAIEIAEHSNHTLRIAAKIDPADQSYFATQIKPLLKKPFVEFIGEITDFQKSNFLGQAKALLFPTDWPEPFGLVMIEALACGTPVIAWRNGSVPEVIEHGVTGFIVDNTEDAIAAVERIDQLDRARVRARFEARFTAEQMAKKYLQLYKKLKRPRPQPISAASEIA